jgi:hypothetical protein
MLKYRISFYIQGVDKFATNLMGNIKIVGARMVTWNKFQLLSIHKYKAPRTLDAGDLCTLHIGTFRY